MIKPIHDLKIVKDLNINFDCILSVHTLKLSYKYYDMYISYWLVHHIGLILKKLIYIFNNQIHNLKIIIILRHEKIMKIFKNKFIKYDI